MDILSLIFKIYLNNKINMILKFMLKLVKYLYCNWANMVKICLTSCQCFEKNEIQNIFYQKIPPHFRLKNIGKTRSFPIFENFRKMPKFYWDILFRLSSSMGSFPNPFHHFSGILLIIWLFFSGCADGSRSSNSEPNHLTKVTVSGNLLEPMPREQR